MNQTIVVENRSGANGGIAVSALTSAPADGTTFVVTDGAILSINPQLYSKMPYNPKDVLPIAALATAPLFLAVHPSMPVDDHERVHRACEGEPRQVQHRLVGRRQHPSYFAGGAEARARPQYQPHPVQGHRRSGAGAARRPCADPVLGLSVAGGRRRHQDASRCLRPMAQSARRRRPICRRSPNSSRASATRRSSASTPASARPMP